MLSGRGGSHISTPSLRGCNSLRRWRHQDRPKHRSQARSRRRPGYRQERRRQRRTSNRWLCPCVGQMTCCRARPRKQACRSSPPYSKVVWENRRFRGRRLGSSRSRVGSVSSSGTTMFSPSALHRGHDFEGPLTGRNQPRPPQRSHDLSVAIVISRLEGQPQ